MTDSNCLVPETVGSFLQWEISGRRGLPRHCPVAAGTWDTVTGCRAAGNQSVIATCCKDHTHTKNALTLPMAIEGPDHCPDNIPPVVSLLTMH